MMDVEFQPVQLALDFQRFVTADYSQITLDSPIQHQKRDLAWLYEPYGGYPNTFVKQNTGIRQLWWNANDIDFADIGDQLNMKVITVSSLRQDPGNVIPLHVDAFHRMRSISTEHQGTIPVRANIFLADSDIGHVLQFVVKEKIISATSWVAGQGFLFNQNVPHLSVNAGLRPKYTLQVSGWIQCQEQ